MLVWKMYLATSPRTSSVRSWNGVLMPHSCMNSASHKLLRTPCRSHAKVLKDRQNDNNVTMAVACHRIGRVCCQSHKNSKPIIRHSPNGGVVSCLSAIDVNSGGVRGTSFFSANWSVEKAHRAWRHPKAGRHYLKFTSRHDCTSRHKA